jgi:hypothetical protein
MAPRWIPAGGGQIISRGAVANAQAPSFANTTPPPPSGPSGQDVVFEEEVTGQPLPGGGGGGYDDSDIRAELAALRAELEGRREAERAEATAFLRDILTMYGMEDLAGDIDRIVRESGNQKSVIQNKIRQTQSYKDRFKGLLNLQQKGITDIQNEAEYIQLESNYRTAFRESGLRDYLGGAGTKTERDAIAKLVGDFSVSVNEVRDRITDAQRVVAETPQEVRDSLQRFYNVDPGTLTAYVLDPQRTTGEIQRRANAAIVGGYAQRAGLEFGAGVSERIGEFLGGERDITGTQIEPQLTQIAGVQRSTGRLAQLEGGMLTAEETALGQLELDEAAQRRVRGLQSRERARFGGTSGVTTGTLSRAPSV